MRESGILMPVSSLPGPYGIGCFGAEALKFVDFLAAAGQHIWQLLPLSPTGYGDSPYQSCSAFAGNPYFVDLEALEKEGFEVTLLDVHADGLVTAQQVAVLFLLIGTGMVAVKTGVLKLENKQALSNLLVYIIVPAMVVNSYRMEFSTQILHNLLAAFGMSVLSVLLGTVITLLLTAHKTGSRMPIFRFACIFSNAAYMGFPLISALFGSEGLLYASAYVTVFNILLWTLGYGLVSGGSSVKEVARSLVRTPVLYAIVVGLGIYLLQIPLPALITQPLELLAGVNTPLSMLITGMLIAAGEVNKDRSPYASKTAIRDVHARRLANLEYLKSCELENKATGERIDLISKVMASISNPEIRRMELMNTIAGIERYAASVGDVGMFITITTPSKYHPTRQVGKGENKTVQLNHGWNDEAYTPKDGQRYLCGIWSKMRTAFKDNDLQVYGMRVVEPHHDATPHWHMMLFCKRSQRKQIIDIMRRYAMKEDGNERGAARNRFEAKHLNKGGAAGYIAKYIAKNIDGYALDGQLDKDTGKPLKDTASAVTAWASTWRIPQFKPIGIPTMGAYRELRKLPRGVSIASDFDERVEAARAAADEGEFDFYIAAQGGANVKRGDQTVRVARTTTDEVNEYEEDIERVVGIYAPHLGAGHIRITRTSEWRIVPKAVAVEPLTLKSGIAAPRSPVNNCGLSLNKADNSQYDYASKAKLELNNEKLRKDAGRVSVCQLYVKLL